MYIFVMSLLFLHLNNSVEISGYEKGMYYQNIYGDRMIDKAAVRTQLQLYGHLGTVGSYFSAIDFEINDSILTNSFDSRKDGFKIFPVEMYLTISKGAFDFKIGKQFIFWGKTDWIIPTDLICPWDYINMSSEIEDYRIPVWALRTQAFFGNFTIDFVFNPVFNKNLMPSPQISELNGIPVIKTNDNYPKASLENSSFGLRVTHTLSGFDYSFMVYKGFFKNPDISFSPVFENGNNAPPSGFVMNLDYKDLTAFGGDFEFAVGKFLFKGESALYVKSDDDDLKNVTLKSVASLFFNASDDFNLELQYINDAMLKKEDVTYASNRAFPGSERPVSYGSEKDDMKHSASMKLNFKFFDDLKITLLFLMHLKDYDLFSLSYLKYNIYDNINFFLGAVWFYGDSDTTFGRLKDYSKFFAELKVSF